MTLEEDSQAQEMWLASEPGCHGRAVKRNKYHLTRTLQKNMKIKVDAIREKRL